MEDACYGSPSLRVEPGYRHSCVPSLGKLSAGCCFMNCAPLSTAHLHRLQQGEVCRLALRQQGLQLQRQGFQASWADERHVQDPEFELRTKQAGPARRPCSDCIDKGNKQVKSKGVNKRVGCTQGAPLRFPRAATQSSNPAALPWPPQRHGPAALPPAQPAGPPPAA